MAGVAARKCDWAYRGLLECCDCELMCTGCRYEKYLLGYWIGCSRNCTIKADEMSSIDCQIWAINDSMTQHYVAEHPLCLDFLTRIQSLVLVDN